MQCLSNLLPTGPCSVQSLTLAANIFVICKTKDWGNKLTTAADAAAAAQKRASGTHNCCIKIAFHLPQNEAIVGQQWHATGSPSALLYSALVCSHRRCDADVKLRACAALLLFRLPFCHFLGKRHSSRSCLTCHTATESAHTQTHTHTHAKQNM